jgi:hypothetical protein
MDDMPADERVYPPSVSKLSKTPSWIMLGFVLGALTVLTFPHQEPEPPPPSRIEPTKRAVQPTPPTVERGLFFEGVFEEWSKYAVWENDMTEVAFWNAETGAFSDRFEVYRTGDRNYFRSITRFTRPVLTHGVPENSPLQFTETQAARDEWLRESTAEQVRTFLDGPAGTAPAAPKKS